MSHMPSIPFPNELIVYECITQKRGGGQNHLPFTEQPERPRSVLHAAQRPGIHLVRDLVRAGGHDHVRMLGVADAELDVRLDARAEERGGDGLGRRGRSLVHGGRHLGDVARTLGRALGELAALQRSAVDVVIRHAADVDVALASDLADREFGDHALLGDLLGHGVVGDLLDGLVESGSAHLRDSFWFDLRNPSVNGWM